MIGGVVIRLYTDTTLGLAGCVLDGEGRLTLAAELGVDAPVIDAGPMTTADAYELAKVLNDHRRHDDPEAIRPRRQERIERVVEARAEGKSLRTIADKEGVDEKTIRKDLKDAGADPSAPETVVG